MDISEVKQNRNNLEQNLLRLFSEFESITSTIISEVRIERDYVIGDLGGITINVRIELTI
jgi:hypothetical protein